MNLEQILITVLEHTDGWVIVVVFGLFFGYRIYRTYCEGQSLKILDKTIHSLLKGLNNNVLELTSKIDEFLNKGAS